MPIKRIEESRFRRLSRKGKKSRKKTCLTGQNVIAGKRTELLNLREIRKCDCWEKDRTAKST